MSYIYKPYDNFYQMATRRKFETLKPLTQLQN